MTQYRFKKPQVMFYGDSRAADWPAPELTEFEFVNRGLPGQDSINALQRFDIYVRPNPPQVMVLQVGINDLTAIPLLPDERKNIVRHCKDNIRRITTNAVDLGIKVIVTTIFPVGQLQLGYQHFGISNLMPYIAEVNMFLEMLAGSKVTVFDTEPLLAENENLKADYALDMLHLNSYGYAILNKKLTVLLMKLLRQV